MGYCDGESEELVGATMQIFNVIIGGFCKLNCLERY